MGDIYDTPSVIENLQEQTRRRAEIDAVAAVLSRDASRLFWQGVFSVVLYSVIAAFVVLVALYLAFFRNRHN